VSKVDVSPPVDQEAYVRADLDTLVIALYCLLAHCFQGVSRSLQ